MRRFSLALMATIVAALAVTSTASAAITPGKFNIHFTAAKLQISGLGAVDAPSGQTIDLHANVAADGKVGIPVNALAFPYIDLGDALPIPGLVATIGQTSRSDGTFNGTTGAASIPLKLFVYVGDGQLPNTNGSVICKIPINATLDTGAHTFGTDTAVNGSPADGSGNIVLAGIAPIPSSVPAGSCDLFDILKGLLPANAQVGLALTGVVTMPGGTPYPDPGSTPPPPVLTASTATLQGKSVSAKKGIVIKCGGTPATVKACTGAASLSVTTLTTKTVTKKVKGKKKKVKVTTKKTVKLPSVNYTSPAGGTATVKFAVSSAVAKSLKANKNKLAGSLAVTNTNGTGVSATKVSLVK